MEFSKAVEAKLQDDPELLDLIKNGNPDSDLSRAVLVGLNVPELPQGELKEEEKRLILASRVGVGNLAEQKFGAINGLTIHNVMKHVAAASVSGTPQALAEVLELDCVKDAVLGDRKSLRGAVGDSTD